MAKRKNLFTLVEVLLALGVCAIGVCSIMVLFPVGASASRDAGAETYAANFADEFLHFKQYEILEKNGGQWDAMVKEGGSNMIARPLPNHIFDFRRNGANLCLSHDDISQLREKVQDGNLWSSTDGDLIPEMRVLNGHPEVFQINAKSGRSDDENDYFTKSDFRCIAVFWQEKISFWNDDHTEEIDIPDSLATRLKVEISWPAEIPYGQRKNRIFTLEIFNNAKRSQP